MNGKWRTWLATLLRYAICIAAVSWVVHHTRWDQLVQVWTAANKPLLLLSIVCFGPALLLIAIRLKLLLDVHDIRLTIWESIKVTFAGNFVINALPVGTPGGDSVKAFYVARNTPRKHEAVTVVFFDRVIGVLGLVLMSGLVILLDWHNPAFKGWGRLIGVLVLCFLGGGALYFSNWMRRLLRLDVLLSKLPLGGHLQRIDQAVFEFRQHPRVVFICLVLAIVLQLNCMASVFLAGWALGLVNPARPLSSIPVYLGYTPIGLLAGALPLGVMETTFQQLFSQAARLGSKEAALSLSLFCRFMQLLWALPGGLVLLRSRPQMGAASPEVAGASGS